MPNRACGPRFDIRRNSCLYDQSLVPLVATIGGLLVLALLVPVTRAAEPTTLPASSAPGPAMREVLTAEQWREVERGTDRALAWLAAQQQPDGCFPVPRTMVDFSQPAVTALAVMAFLSRGHLPGEGPRGQNITRGIEYVLSCQQNDGLIARRPPRIGAHMMISNAAAYNHAISGLMLSEAYGMTTGELNRRIRSSLDAALKVALRKQPQPKRYTEDQGGWRYPVFWQDSDSDLSVTSWYLMFLRSCRNAGLEVPSAPIDQAVGYVRRCYDPQQHHFWYALRGNERIWTRAMVGAGILSLSLGGEHESQMAQQAGDWLLRHPFDRYRVPLVDFDRFFYGAFYCSHAAFQLGGRHWAQFYPVLTKTLLDHQSPDGSWDPEVRSDAMYGRVYSTSLAVLALSPPFQLLPIFQR